MRVILAVWALRRRNTFGACSFNSMGEKSVVITSTTLGNFDSSALSHAPPAPISKIRPRNSRPHLSVRNGINLGRSSWTERNHSVSDPDSMASRAAGSRSATVRSWAYRDRYCRFSMYFDPVVVTWFCHTVGSHTPARNGLFLIPRAASATGGLKQLFLVIVIRIVILGLFCPLAPAPQD